MNRGLFYRRQSNTGPSVPRKSILLLCLSLPIFSIHAQSAAQIGTLMRRCLLHTAIDGSPYGSGCKKIEAYIASAANQELLVHIVQFRLINLTSGGLFEVPGDAKHKLHQWNEQNCVRLRGLALERITDNSLLLNIATDDSLVNEGDNRTLMLAVAKIDDQKALASFAEMHKSAKPGYVDKDQLIVVLGKLRNQSVLTDVARQNQDFQVRFAAFSSMDRDSLLPFCGDLHAETNNMVESVARIFYVLQEPILQREFPGVKLAARASYYTHTNTYLSIDPVTKEGVVVEYPGILTMWNLECEITQGETIIASRQFDAKLRPSIADDQHQIEPEVPIEGLLQGMLSRSVPGPELAELAKSAIPEMRAAALNILSRQAPSR